MLSFTINFSFILFISDFFPFDHLSPSPFLSLSNYLSFFFSIRSFFIIAFYQRILGEQSTLIFSSSLCPYPRSSVRLGFKDVRFSFICFIACLPLVPSRSPPDHRPLASALYAFVSSRPFLAATSISFLDIFVCFVLHGPFHSSLPSPKRLIRL